jgi:N-glycosylase/DNA lyase
MKQQKFNVSKKEINFAQTLKCGQIFSYKQINDRFIIFSKDKKAEVVENDSDYTVFTDDIAYFKNFLDLETDYNAIKEKLIKDKLLFEPINFGSGIRILRQDILEVIIAFVFSANNNIKRITSSIFALREKFGSKKNDFFTFPTLEQLSKITEQDFKDVGAGYRASQLVKLIKQLQNTDINQLRKSDTKAIRNYLIGLSGIGPKVADCILLFGFNRTDVFPVDTWIEKVYNLYYKKCDNRILIRKNLIQKYGNLSGYAQQYLFYFQRSQ